MAKRTDFSAFEPTDKQAWLDAVKASAGEEDIKKLVHESADGYRLSAYYDFSDLERIEFKDSLPGYFPFVNGFATGKTPKIRAFVPVEKFMLAGQLSVEAAENGAEEVFWTGDHFGNENESEHLFNSVNWEKTAVHAHFGESGTAFAYILADELEKRGMSTKTLQGGICRDFLGHLTFSGGYDYSASESLNVLVALLHLGKETLPNFSFLHVRGHLLHNAGATPGMELGFVFAQLTEYYDLLTDKGFSPDFLTQKLEVSLAVSADDYFASIAKLRAFRVLWSTWAEQFNISEALTPSVHVVSSRRNKTAFDEYNNLLRLSAEGMAAYLGGCDSLMLIPHDETFRKGNSFSSRVAINLQHLLRFESKMAEVTDPAAGSYYLESLTDKLIDTAWIHFQECEKLGGYTAALHKKHVQGLVERSASAEQILFNDSKKILVGANKFPAKEEQLSSKAEKGPISAEMADRQIVMPLKEKRLAEGLEAAKLRAEKESVLRESTENETEEE
jgi:methylmalonyl-CoA mutase